MEDSFTTSFQVTKGLTSIFHAHFATERPTAGPQPFPEDGHKVWRPTKMSNLGLGLLEVRIT